MEEPTTRTCTKCGETKPLDCFHKRGRNLYSREAHCKVCHNKKVNEWRRRNPEKHAAYKRAHHERHPGRVAALARQRAYGITPEDWNALFESQGRVCAVCGSDKPGRNRTEWATDHCHETGKIRGILCHVCNVGLGLLGDSPDRLRAALAYLLA